MFYGQNGEIVMSYVTEVRVSALDSSNWQPALPGSDWQVVRNASGVQDFSKGAHGNTFTFTTDWAAPTPG